LDEAYFIGARKREIAGSYACKLLGDSWLDKAKIGEGALEPLGPHRVDDFGRMYFST